MSVSSAQENNRLIACGLVSLQMVSMEGLPMRTLAPSVFEGIAYTSSLLLEGRFDASITDHAAFRAGCKDGFEAYFEDMYEIDEEDNEVFVDRFYTWAELEDLLVRNVARRYDLREQFMEQMWGGVSPLAWRAGFCLGWLSALALVDRVLAEKGLDFLSVLVPACQIEEAARAA